MLAWINEHQHLVFWLAGISAVTFFGTLIAIPLLVVRMPQDYFLEERPPPESWRAQHRAVHMTLRALKDLLGVLLVLAGIVLAMPLVPGQGILTILIGLSLLDFPGKRRLELRLAGLRTVLAAINWIRARADRPPLRMPPRDGTRSRSK